MYRLYIKACAFGKRTFVRPNRLDLNPTPRVRVHLYKQSMTKVIFHENKMPFFYPELEVQNDAGSHQET